MGQAPLEMIFLGLYIPFKATAVRMQVLNKKLVVHQKKEQMIYKLLGVDFIQLTDLY